MVRRKRRRSRRMARTIDAMFPIGGVLFMLGLAGMAEACTGQGHFMVGAVMFAVGFGICFENMKGGSGNE